MPSLPPVHSPLGTTPEQARRQRNREHDARRGSARERGYTTRWDKYAKLYIRRHPLCVGCQACGWTEPATCVDHIEPAELAPDRFWDTDNHQGACDWHHAQVKQRMEAMLKRGEAKVSDMRLDSELAQRISFEIRPAR